MTILAALIFVFCIWAVFSHNFHDGIVTKHLFSFSAITSALTVLDPINRDAFMVSIWALGFGLIYWAIKRCYAAWKIIKTL